MVSHTEVTLGSEVIEWLQEECRKSGGSPVGGRAHQGRGPSGLTSVCSHFGGGPFSSRPQDTQPYAVWGRWLQPVQFIAAELWPQNPGLFLATWGKCEGRGWRHVGGCYSPPLMDTPTSLTLTYLTDSAQMTLIDLTHLVD